jgi:5,10-methylenetetrahydrofolate reductase
MLLKSVGMARYIDRHLEQIHIPAGLIDRIQKASERVRECIQVAAELIAALKNEGYSGVMISTLGWEDRLPAMLSAARV